MHEKSELVGPMDGRDRVDVPSHGKSATRPCPPRLRLPRDPTTATAIYPRPPRAAVKSLPQLPLHLEFNHQSEKSKELAVGTLSLLHPPSHGGDNRGMPEARDGSRLPRRPLLVPRRRPAAPAYQAGPVLVVDCRRGPRPQLPARVRPGRGAPSHLPRRGSAGASMYVRVRLIYLIHGLFILVLIINHGEQA